MGYIVLGICQIMVQLIAPIISDLVREIAYHNKSSFNGPRLVIEYKPIVLQLKSIVV